MRKLLNALVVGLAVFATGCASLFEDNLDRAYKSGELNSRDYYQLKAQQEAARRDRLFRQQQSYREQQNAVLPQVSQQMSNTRRSSTISMPYLQEDSRQGGFGGSARPQSESEPVLPSALALDQMRQGAGFATGRNRLSQDGVFYYEYRLPDGTTYWRPSR